jgi:hypothetical protein
MTYLELVNDILVRLREDEVTAVTDNAYSKLIGKFVNDAKRQVEDAYNWNVLSETLTATTSEDLFNYVLVGSGTRFRVIDVINEEQNSFLINEPTSRMNELFLNLGSQKGPPNRYNFNGANENGDTQVDLHPIPDGVYNIYFNIIKPQDALSVSADILKVPAEPVIFLAYSKAIAERGEDQGVFANEAYELFKTSLSDHIATEANRYPDALTWGST